MPQTAGLPVVDFNDDLAIRARQNRVARIGNPYEFLDSIGIVPIKEFLFRGANIIDVADSLNVPITAIHLWVDKNGHKEEMREASKISAEGYLFRGEQMLAKAITKFELDKAKAMLEHGRFMAAKKDKGQYGTLNEGGPTGAGVTYIFNMGGQPPPEKEFLEGVATLVPKDALTYDLTEPEAISIEMDFGAAEVVLQEIPVHVREAGTAAKVEPIREVDQWIK